MKKIPMLEKFAAQSLAEYEGELIFSKEKFAELIVQECAYINFYKRTDISLKDAYRVSKVILEHFGVEQ